MIIQYVRVVLIQYVKAVLIQYVRAVMIQYARAVIIQYPSVRAATKKEFARGSKMNVETSRGMNVTKFVVADCRPSADVAVMV